MPLPDLNKAISPEHFVTQALDSAAWGPSACRVLAAAVGAVEPGQAVRRHLRRTGDILKAGERSYMLDGFRQIYLIAAGKAAEPMAAAAQQVLGNKLAGGVVITKEGYATRSSLPGGIRILEAGHPLPDRRGIEGAQQVIGLLDQAAEDTLVLCLLSGGGSALLTLPADQITLRDLQALTDQLLACGASIHEINTLRKHLDQVKGGKLARRAAPASLISLVLSDVVGDPLDVIASGPTVADGSTYGDAVRILERHGIAGKTPPSILAHLERGAAGEEAENPGPGNVVFDRVQNLIVGNNQMAAQAALQQAQEEGFNTLLLSTYLQGEARHAGRFLAALAQQVDQDGQPIPRPACLAAGGETTVTLRGSGKGGRNQELALGAVRTLAGLPQVALVSLATDGGDGPTDAAGAVATGETLARARQLGFEPEDFLARNDAYHFFGPLGDLLMTGPTQTNVNDLMFVFAF